MSWGSPRFGFDRAVFSEAVRIATSSVDSWINGSAPALKDVVPFGNVPCECNDIAGIEKGASPKVVGLVLHAAYICGFRSITGSLTKERFT